MTCPRCELKVPELKEICEWDGHQWVYSDVCAECAKEECDA